MGKVNKIKKVKLIRNIIINLLNSKILKYYLTFIKYMRINKHLKYNETLNFEKI